MRKISDNNSKGYFEVILVYIGCLPETEKIKTWTLFSKSFPSITKFENASNSYCPRIISAFLERKTAKISGLSQLPCENI